MGNVRGHNTLQEGSPEPIQHLTFVCAVRLMGYPERTILPPRVRVAPPCRNSSGHDDHPMALERKQNSE